MLDQFRINPKNSDISLQDIKPKIDKGFELQELDFETQSRDEAIKYSNAIILAPDYQREYRSSIADESSLIESILLGIPIPAIFFASRKVNLVPVLNVVDGQHRLRAFYRFMNNAYALKDLKILKTFEGKRFKDLKIDEVHIFNSTNISAVIFQDFPGENFELEIFKRYNQGTKPLTPQEIRHAVYSSRINDMVNTFCKETLELTNKDDNYQLKIAYAISKEKYQKKKIQESIFVILSILENGISQRLNKSPEYAESYMKSKNEFEKMSVCEEDIVRNLEITKTLFTNFNRLIKKLTSKTVTPFSKEIYGVSSRSNKFQVSISMILSSIYHDISSKINIDALLEDEEILRFHETIEKNLINSYLEDPDYNASTTNPIEIEKLTNKICTELAY
ncbi:DUF262 domain-containing protein [Shewanella gelidimarina]|uniref:DUF262 domain-containing protein n=1 Tax=Shewanella gelidimarina TaxID=56813 RepID=UPI00200E9C0C|nr:DUF262 domain-containing protein [Shewanella gelidimarina]MCL1056804.1 DUF262 domain-containing protein [Shewanella gelidimarina]